MKIYTRTGDEGTTGTVGGGRIAKDSLRMAAVGSVDELNGHIGLARSACFDDLLAGMLQRISHELFDLGADLATPVPPDADTAAAQRISAAHVEWLETDIDRCWRDLPPLHQFILPGGTELAARLHVARPVCRRAERDVLAFSRSEPIGGHTLAYLNRLSDLLFAMARYANHVQDTDDVLWRG